MKTVEDVFGIKTDDNSLFLSAITHPSYTYKKFPDYHEGDMSKIRSIAVSDSVLSEISKKMGLADIILASEHDEKQGIKKLESVTACAFEAVLGAYFLDNKADLLDKKLQEIFLPYIEEINANLDKYNAKALLQEYTQSLTRETPKYRLVAESGPAHNRIFTVEVSYNGDVIAQADGKSKKEAEQRCAYLACQKLGVLECRK